MTRVAYVLIGALVGLALTALQPSSVLEAQRQSSTTQYLAGATDATPLTTAIGWFDGTTERPASTAYPLPVTASISLGADVDVQSGGADLATQATAAVIAGDTTDIETAVETLVSTGIAVTSLPPSGSTAAAVPSAAIYNGINIGGNLVGVTGATEGSINAPYVILADPDTNAAVSYAGCTLGSFIGGASVNETAIKASAGRLYWMTITSLDATPVYIKLYNDTTANIDETDTPTVRIGVPANATAALLAGHTVTWPNGAVFSTAITVRTTTGILDNDTGALTANEVLVNYCYT